MTLQIHIPYPPSANRLWIRAKKGVRKDGKAKRAMRKSDEYAKWLVDAGWHIKAQRPGKIEGPYKLSLLAARPDKRHRDISNLIKATEDVLQSVGIIRNDSDCEMITARWVTIGSGVQVFIDPTGTE
jgi:Holliday junction resolvase RusA-like endonuclease